MAGGKVGFGSKIKASTILEVVVSMVVIVLVFGIAMTIYANVLRFSVSAQKIKAEAELQKQLEETEEEKNPVSQTLTVDDLRIEQEIKPYVSSAILLEVDLAAYDVNQQKVSELSKVIIAQ